MAFAVLAPKASAQFCIDCMDEHQRKSDLASSRASAADTNLAGPRLLSPNPRVFRPLRVIASFVGLLLVSHGAHADDTHYRGIPIGAHAIGLGGAFVGVADDASATYFNPAGLTLGGNFGLAAGLSINAWERFELDRAYAPPDGVASFKIRTNRSVPIFVGAGFKFGPRTVDGEKKFALGLSVVEPTFSAGGVFLKISAPELALADTYEATFRDRATWYGLSFAGRFKKKHSLAVALHLSVRKLNHAETGLALAGGTPTPEDPDVFVGTSSAANTHFLGLNAYHFVLRLGWLFRAKRTLQIGVMLQPPGIPLRQTAGVLSQGFVNDNRDAMTGLLTQAYFLDEKVNANLPIPLELEAGVEYWPAKKVMLALDASFHGPVRSSERAALPQDVPIGGLFFDNDTRRLPTGNVALAGDFLIGKRITIQAGFFTDISSAVKIPDNPTRYYNDRINRFGGTLSFGVNATGINLAIGSTVVYGRGDATGVVVDTGNTVLDYTRTQATSRIVYVHLTGVTRAVGKVAGKAYRGVRKRRRSK